MFINRLCKTFQIRISYLIKSNMQMPCMFVPFPRVGLHYFLLCSCKISLFPNSALSNHTVLVAAWYFIQLFQL